MAVPVLVLHLLKLPQDTARLVGRVDQHAQHLGQERALPGSETRHFLLDKLVHDPDTIV